MRHRRDPLHPSTWPLWVAAGVVTLLWLAPFGWMLSTSLKSLPEVLAAPLAPIPSAPRLDAYADVLRAIPIGHYFLNTVAMAASIAALQIVLGLPAAYALAKLRFRGREAVFGIVMFSLWLPAQVRFVPTFVMFAEMGIVNTMAALVLPFAVSGFGIFWFRQGLASVPDTLIEAARLDGASELRIVYGILAPLLAPTLAAFFIFSFVLHYNDYFWPLVMTTDDAVRTLPLGVALLREQGTGIRWNVMMAANVLLSLPPIAIFTLAQRQLLRAVAQH